MAEFIGRRVNLGASRESSRGTDPGSVSVWLPRTELTFQDRVDKVVSGQSHGHIDDATDAFVVAKYGEGNFTTELRDKSVGLFLYSMLGTCVSSALGGGDYSHAFSEANSNQHQSLTLYMDDPNGSDLLFELTMLNSLTLTLETGQLAMISADFMSKSGDATTVTATYSSENRFLSRHLAVKLASAVGGLGAASELPIKTMTITFTKNLVRDYNFGTVDPTEIHNQQFSVEGQFTLNLEDSTYLGYMQNNDYKAMRIAAVNTDVTLGGGNNPSLTIDLSRCHFFSWERNNALDEITSQTIQFKALRDVTNSLNIVNACTLVNTQASY